MPCNASRALVGSSPLARGAPGVEPAVCHGLRFIPARAGSTCPAVSQRAGTAVHPRSRGEHLICGAVDGLRGGSSPLARGARTGLGWVGPLHRFIPARAGSTAWRRAPTIRLTGSSPLARGAQQATQQRQHRRRFIPARAGSTPAPGHTRAGGSVHPRSRGEHNTKRTTSFQDGGSSPLARGAHRPSQPPRPNRRFIPARAGSTRTPRATVKRSAVHPRSRGEHHGAQQVVALAVGSSPLARGAPSSSTSTPTPARFIPARAGSTRAPTRWCR